MSYKQTRRDVAVADEYLASHMACRVCHVHVQCDELSAFGAQCKACYDAYCADAPTRNPAPRTHAQRKALLNGMALQSTGGITTDQAGTVARRLRALEAAGMRLTDGQLWVLSRCEAKAGMSAE